MLSIINIQVVKKEYKIESIGDFKIKQFFYSFLSKFYELIILKMTLKLLKFSQNKNFN